MTKLDRHSGLRDAHNVLLAYTAELNAEHRNLPPTFFGGLRPRHREIAAIGKALCEIGARMVERGAEIVAEKEPRR